MSNINPNENCHAYCPVAKCCRYAEGKNGLSPKGCETYPKILDLLEVSNTQKAKEIKARMESEDW